MARPVQYYTCNVRYLCTSAALKWPPLDVAVGNPVNPSFIPIEYLGYGQRMTFKERLANTLMM